MKIILIFLLFSIVSISAKSLQGRIFYGDNVEISFAPYQVELLLNLIPFCGGSLLSENFVLTAAHCIHDEKDPKNYRISAGTKLIIDIIGQLIHVLEIFEHPDYNEISYDSDFGLLLLEKIENFPKTAGFVKLPNKDDILEAGEIMNIAGFGDTEKGFTFQLKGGNVPIYDQEKCNKHYGEILTNMMICAGHEESGETGSCLGDSGSGLVRKSDGKIFGVTSFGTKADKCSIHPVIYSKVTEVLDWVNEIISKDH